jgi:hypothetical protein
MCWICLVELSGIDFGGHRVIFTCDKIGCENHDNYKDKDRMIDVVLRPFYQPMSHPKRLTCTHEHTCWTCSRPSCFRTSLDTFKRCSFSFWVTLLIRQDIVGAQQCLCVCIVLCATHPIRLTNKLGVHWCCCKCGFGLDYLLDEGKAFTLWYIIRGNMDGTDAQLWRQTSQKHHTL